MCDMEHVKEFEKLGFVFQWNEPIVTVGDKLKTLVDFPVEYLPT